MNPIVDQDWPALPLFAEHSQADMRAAVENAENPSLESCQKPTEREESTQPEQSLPVVELKSPYPYFGGKSTVAKVVWERFGNTPNYIEPFFGSGAMLLARPVDHLLNPRTETVNDKDNLICNFWRAIQHDPESVAYYADWPVIESDLHARHAWLVGQKESLTSKLEGNPTFYDAKIAGWWVWGMSCWIGGGFCDGSGPWHVVDGELINVRESEAEGVAVQRPQLSHEQGITTDCVLGAGVCRKLPHLSGDKGVSRKRIQLASGKGVSRQMRHLSGYSGVVRQLPELKSDLGGHRDHSSGLYAYFDQLQTRMRRVRVCSGDWSRITGPSVTVGNGLTAVFLDPPYTHEGRDTDLYVEDEANIVSDVRLWAIANGDNPMLRIAYCGYEDGFEWPESWTAYRWKANGGYGNQGDGNGKKNKHKETIWFSPHCLKPSQQLSIFDIPGVQLKAALP